MVARTSVVLTKRWTVPACTQGEITSRTERWESTWSGPACASSSTTKTAVLFQNGDLLSASTNRPSARSLSAMQARGVQ